MNLPQARPGPFAGPLFVPVALSIILHLLALAWLHPRSAWQPVLPQFDLRVRLAPPQVPALAPPPPPARRLEQRAAPRPGPLPPRPAAPQVEPLPPQPLRMRIVADPGDYGLGANVPGRPYAWPGELVELPFPPGEFRVRYPEEQLHSGQKGLVVVRADISSAGVLEQVEVVCGAAPFDAAVLEALRATRFRPPVARKGPVPAWTVLEFAFLAGPESGAGGDPRSAERALADLQAGCTRR